MKPILFAPDAAEFNNNGLGVLADSPRCEVTEERNGPYELEMDYPIDGQHFSEITHSAIIYAVPADGKDPQPFRVYDITKPLDGLCTIYAEHISYQLAHIPVTPFGRCTSVVSALQGLKNNAAETCPFTFWTDKASTGTFEVKEPISIREMLGDTRGSILDAFGGGEYEWDGYTVKLYQHRGHDKGVTIRYGRNLTDLKQDEAIDSTVTGIYPFWSDSNSGTLVTLPEKVLHSENADNFPYVRTIVVDASSEFQEAPTETQLRDFGTRYIANNAVGVPKVSIEVSFAPLWQTEEYRNIANLERVNLCDTVTVVFEKLGVSATAKVVKTIYDVLNERYDTIELGDARTNLGKAVSDDISGSVLAIRQAIPSKSVIEGIVEAQTSLITGGLGGYVRFVYNADGEPQELLFMDTDDIQTAVNVIRINRNGIGFSNDGYDPTKFVSAWTIDGQFSADFIATGHLLANFIQGGTLSLGGTDNGNGVIQVFDGNNNLVGKWDKDGLSAIGDLEMKKGDIWGLVGSVPYLTWLAVEGQARLDTFDGFSVKNESPTALISSHSIIPRSDRVLDQTLASTKFLKSFVFTDDIETSGNMFYLEIDKKSFTLYPARYGTASAVSQAPEASIDEDGVSVKSGGATISVKSGSGVSGDGEIHISAPSKTTGHNSTQADMDYSSILLQSGSRNQKIDINGNSLSIRANGASIYLNGSNSSQSALQLMGGNKGLRIDGSVAQITSDGGSSWSQLAFASSSSKRYKHGIKPLSEDRDSHRLLALPVVEFDWNTDHPLQYEDMRDKTVPGIIAEDVAEIYPSAVIHNADGDVESWDERRIIPGMLALIQEQDKKIKDLEARLAKLEEMLT